MHAGSVDRALARHKNHYLLKFLGHFVTVALVDLALNLPSGRGLGRRLYAELRRAMLESRLRPGDRLPSSRELARRLAVARNTVSEAYERLAREGYLESRPGSGTFVADHDEPLSARDTSAAWLPTLSQWAGGLPQSRSIVPSREMAYDFRPGLPDLANVPIAAWRRLAAHNLRTLSHEIGGYGDPAGLPRLRAAIARYVSQSRAVSCTPDDLLVCSGTQQALDLLTRVLVDRGTVVAVENPGYTPPSALFRAAGATVVPVRVDDEGLVVDELPHAARVVYVTPSHQFPLGVSMSLARRKSLLAWARARAAIVVEDDYDSEFRFGGRPLESLQGLDSGAAVAYVGTFSKVLFPGLRLGYLVVPPQLREPLLAAKWMTDRHSSALEQCVMADFIAHGHFRRHLHRMQGLYAERRAALATALRRWTGTWLAPVPSYAGLHLTALLPASFDVEELLRRAHEAGVGIYSLVPFYAGDARPGLVFGYAACAVPDIEEGIRRLGGLLRSMRIGEGGRAIEPGLRVARPAARAAASPTPRRR
jgi:GntR family transcriptional regulator/MocR family aminotransferase